MNLIDAEKYIKINGYYFPEDKIDIIKDKLLELNDINSDKVQNLVLCEPNIALFMSILGGFLGKDYFFIGDIGLGLLKLFTLGGLGIWWIADWFTIRDKAKEENFNRILYIFKNQEVDNSVS